MFFFNFILFKFTILYWFCHISKWICHRYTCVPHPEPSSLLPPHTIPLGHPSAPAPSIQYCASNLDRWLVSYMILYMFQCHSPKSSHPLPLPQSPKDCSIHQCLFCCLVYNQGKCSDVLVKRLSREKPWFAVFASNYSVNTPTMVDFKLLMWSHRSWNWEDRYRINYHKLVQATSSKPLEMPHELFYPLFLQPSTQPVFRPVSYLI